MRAEIISVGTELLLGDIVNTNAQFLAQQLAGLGFSVFYQTVVGDNPGRLRSVVNEAKTRSDVLIFTGGLGPTADDLTKETIAEAFGDTLVLDEEELLNLQSYFAGRGVPMGENNRKQAMVPLRGKKLPNPNGTAPGAYFRQNGKYAILLPGPPREMKPMFLNEAVPLLEAMQDAAIRSLTLRVYGIGESALEDKVIDLLDNPNPTAALYAKTGEVHIRITARATTAETADAMCEEYAVLFRRILGDMIYSDNGDDLETTTVRLLIENGKTVATAESCTGGLLGERITSVPGSSAVYGYGAITYANDAKRKMLRVREGTLRRYGAVSGQVAAEMAFGAARRRGDDYGVGITGIAGPDGGTVQKPVGLVYVAVASGRDVYVKKLSMSDRGREYVRELATQNALDMLRRLVLGLEIPGAKRFTKAQEADFERVGKPRRRGGTVLRALTAFLVAAALLVLVITGVWLAGQGGGTAAAAGLKTPAQQGLQYGTDPYAQAATQLVRQAKEENSSVSGFLALPGAEGATIEALVAQPSGSTQQTLAANLDGTGVQGMPVMAQAATPARASTNTLVLGQDTLGRLWELQDTGNAGAVSTFTYYTTNDAKTYQVFAAYVADEGSGGFDPAVESLSGYGAFLEYVVGGKVRSLYDIPIAPEQTDSFMTLAATDPDGEGRCFYVCGKLVPPGETPEKIVAAAAGEPLMPEAWYAGQGRPAPDSQALYNDWMRWYLTRDQRNSGLQLLLGMPAADAYPMVTPLDTRPDPSELPEPESAPESASESVASSAAASDASADTTSPAGSASAGDSGSEAQAASDTDSSDVSGGNSNAQPDDSTAASNAASDAGASSDASASGGPSSASGSAESAPASGSTSSIYVPPAPTPQKADPGTLTVTMNGRVVTGDTADILAQICQAEAAGRDTAVVKALAVAAHSWIMNQQGAGMEAPPVVGRQPSAATRSAVAEVAGLILSGDGANPAFTPWYDMAAFGTNDAETAFGGYRSYLASASSPYEENMEQWRQYFTFTAEEMAGLVELHLGVDLTVAGDPATWFSAAEKKDSGYVTSLKVGEVTVTGMDIWQKVLVEDGKPILPSCAFEIEWGGESFRVITYGSGHGCGLSLHGAGGYVREGWDHERILEHYYPGAKLLQLS